MHDLISFLQRVETKLRCSQSVFRMLQPRFTLMGSVPEGTRLGIANEMDIMIEFEGLAGTPFGLKLEDPYHLYFNDSLWMRKYFDSKGHFLLDKFKRDFLKETDMAVSEVLQECSTRLFAFKNNHGYKVHECQECLVNLEGRAEQSSLYKQCKNCKVLTSQNKVGICLQLGWSYEGAKYRNYLGWHEIEAFTIYTSVDLIPVFPTQPIPLRAFVRATNRAMLDVGHPDEWYEYLVKYLSTDKILKGLGTDDERVTKVLLKLMNCQEERNYMVKTGQILSFINIQFMTPMPLS